MTKFGLDGTYWAYFPFRPDKEGRKVPYKIEKLLAEDVQVPQQRITTVEEQKLNQKED